MPKKQKQSLTNTQQIIIKEWLSGRSIKESAIIANTKVSIAVRVLREHLDFYILNCEDKELMKKISNNLIRSPAYIAQLYGIEFRRAREIKRVLKVRHEILDKGNVRLKIRCEKCGSVETRSRSTKCKRCGYVT